MLSGTTAQVMIEFHFGLFLSSFGPCILMSVCSACFLISCFLLPHLCLLLSDFENVSPSVINNSFSGFFDVLLEAVFSSYPLDTSQQSTLHLAQTSMLSITMTSSQNRNMMGYL